MWQLVTRCCLFSVVMLGSFKPGTPLINLCPQFGVPVSGLWFDTDSYQDFYLDSNGIQAVLNIKTNRSFWVGYENGGFAWADDVMPILTMTMYMVDGSERWVEIYYSAQTPNDYYLLPYANPTWSTDSNGEHGGNHPCAAILMTVAEYESLIASLTPPEAPAFHAKS